MAKFINHYECPCGEEWQDESDYTNDDRCPACNLSCSPTESEDGGGDDSPTVGDRVDHNGREGIIRGFRPSVEGDVEVVYATVEFKKGASEEIDADELEHFNA